MNCTIENDRGFFEIVILSDKITCKIPFAYHKNNILRTVQPIPDCDITKFADSFNKKEPCTIVFDDELDNLLNLSFDGNNVNFLCEPNDYTIVYTDVTVSYDVCKDVVAEFVKIVKSHVLIRVI